MLNGIAVGAVIELEQPASEQPVVYPTVAAPRLADLPGFPAGAASTQVSLISAPEKQQVKKRKFNLRPRSRSNVDPAPHSLPHSGPVPVRQPRDSATPRGNSSEKGQI